MNQLQTSAATPKEDGSHALVAQLATAATEPAELGDAHYHVLAPKDWVLHDLTDAIEQSSDRPYRKRGTVRLHNVESLLSYAKDQGMQQHGYMFADVDARTITAVLNGERELPAWRDHCAVFSAQLTPECETWLNNNKRKFGQTEFAEFIEDNLADLADEQAQRLLEVASTIQAVSGINFASAKRLQDGQTQLTYTETIDARAGASGNLSIPKEFNLGLRIFRGDMQGYKLKARLKYRLAGGTIGFWYELDRPERAIEDAFSGYVALCQEKSGYVVLHGRP